MDAKIPRVDACVTVIYCGERLLTIYNDSWGAFTLPMTKLRRTRPGLTNANQRWERGGEAALRNIAEFLHTTVTREPAFLMDLRRLAQSERDGETKHYSFQIFAHQVGRPVAPAGVVAEWLTPDEILDESREPISPTARNVIVALREQSLSRPNPFPPSMSFPPRRTSTASVAIIKRTQSGQTQWLTQWNEKWGRYFLVGGHQHEQEIPEQCMRRELSEELGLIQHADYESYVRKILSYDGWSASRWESTHYEMTVFDIELKRSAEAKFSRDVANRWLTADEIQSERCHDDKFISPTGRYVLCQTNELRE